MERVVFQRDAEAEHRFDDAATTLNEIARKAHEAQQ